MMSPDIQVVSCLWCWYPRSPRCAFSLCCALPTVETYTCVYKASSVPAVACIPTDVAACYVPVASAVANALAAPVAPWVLAFAVVFSVDDIPNVDGIHAVVNSHYIPDDSISSGVPAFAVVLTAIESLVSLPWMESLLLLPSIMLWTSILLFVFPQFLASLLLLASLLMLLPVMFLLPLLLPMLLLLLAFLESQPLLGSLPLLAFLHPCISTAVASLLLSHLYCC